MESQRTRQGFNRSKVNLFLDIGLALAFVVALEMRFTGLSLHELVGVGLGVGLLTHIVLHWRWIVSITRTFFRKLWHESRFNYLLNIALFIDLAVVVLTGIGISRTLGLNLGLDRSLTSVLQRLHFLSSSFSLLIVGLHVAVHWKWIVTHASKYLFRWPVRRAARPRSVPVSMLPAPSKSNMGEAR